MYLRLIDELRTVLHAEVIRIRLFDDTPDVRRASFRLAQLAEHSPGFIAILAEPWMGAAPDTVQMQLLQACARIHLYARVLDDAIDEKASVYRRQLLRAQPMLWEAVQQIGALVAPPVAQRALALIGETIEAVDADDQQMQPIRWGAKNHHLLLAPLLLSGDSTGYRECREGLSLLIALEQAGDEWRQGTFAGDAGRLRDEFLDFITDRLECGQLELLARHGWHCAAERIVLGARQMMDFLTA